ncbi:hypothetical protein TNIN_459421 [Trichonephila inaurata madagascariensis]|uniref:Uncharacterized protein n=1 Tax=Trichonephila inaurata madagascariensis TaxID=2747483 RepID=A0A8X7BUK8_9ARAC|nr:hypothetical protein TNIN_459421 [Trichonephila inaurata madagascariensis]
MLPAARKCQRRKHIKQQLVRCPYPPARTLFFSKKEFICLDDFYYRIKEANRLQMHECLTCVAVTRVIPNAEETKVAIFMVEEIVF